MRPQERWTAILDRLSVNEHVSTKELSAELGVTSVTVRTDLRFLEEHGRLRRVHGGAVPASHVLETSHDDRGEVDGSQKAAIAALAATLLEPGMTIVLDVGTTTLALAERIANDDGIAGLRVVTNGLRQAACLEPAMPRNEVYVTGGVLRPMQHSLVQSGVIEGLRRFHADLAFIGCDGVDPVHGVTTTNLPEADIKEEMRRLSDRSVLLAAGSKLGEVASVLVNGVGEFDTLITSADADVEVLTRLKQLGLEVLVAPAAADREDSR
ncbi:MAG TPA: DeoR/GlpR family DNA-binding transcription regulator [Propionicimonas sp.]|nr:DeoR/GlpR family DNA-binding transcription regulator [Propionicimonas sp.]HRA05674.1 DeoR/GlpR family DNA-binding transcription regulator [Propionicimonas sp.]